MTRRFLITLGQYAAGLAVLAALLLVYNLISPPRRLDPNSAAAGEAYARTQRIAHPDLCPRGRGNEFWMACLAEADRRADLEKR